MGKRSRRRVTPSAAPQEASPAPSVWRRLRGVLIGLLAVTGVVTAVTAVAVERYKEGAFDTLEGLAGQPAIAIYLGSDIELRPGPSRMWALPSSIKAEVGAGIPDGPAVTSLLSGRQPTSVRTSTYDVVLEGTRAETISITSIKAREVNRLAPLSTALVIAGTGGGPGSAPVKLRFDLDSVDKQALTESGEVFFDVNGLVLERGEKLRFKMIGTTKTSFVEWVVQVYFIVNGKAQMISFPPADDAFRSTAMSKTYTELYKWSTMNGIQPVDAAICTGDCRNVVS